MNGVCLPPVMYRQPESAEFVKTKSTVNQEHRDINEDRTMINTV